MASNTATVIYDTVGPTIGVPAGGVQANTDPGEPGAIVSFTVTATDADPAGFRAQEQGALTLAALISAPAADCVPASGSFFGIGDTTVTCASSDAAGNTSSASFVVTVVDAEAPVVVGNDQSFDLAVGATSGVVDYITPDVADNSGVATIVCTPMSGATFDAGVTTVVCTARDASGNTASAEYAITVNATPEPTVVPAVPPPTGVLPETGSSPINIVPLALGLLALGAVVLAGTRRRALRATR